MRFGIQHKIVILFSVIIFAGLISLLIMSYQITEDNMLQTVRTDMIAAKKSLDIYMNQYFLLSNRELGELSLADEAEGLSRQLSADIGSEVDLYDRDGNQLSGNAAGTGGEELAAAQRGEIAYNVHFAGERAMATLAYPLESGGQTYGIVQYQKDYSQLYAASLSFKQTINMFAVIIFLIVFIASILISRQITKPVRQLSKSSQQVYAGDYNIDIKVSSRDEIGELAGMFKKMVQKIREQIHIIEQERDALKKAQAQNKIFFDNATHEMKTPLTTIIGYAQIIKENAFTEREFFERGLDSIIREGKRLNQTVIEMLTLAQASSAQTEYRMEPVNLGELALETSEELQIKAAKYRIRIQSIVPEKLYVMGDRNRLKEVMINLLDNSINYGDVNSTVRVEVLKQGEVPMLQVTDQGEGIPEAQLEHLFEPFYRVPGRKGREHGSAGLGLAIVKGIIEKHGGSIQVNSKVKEGTTVTVRFEGEVNV
ncbi:HAMP domain-containing histidine kinase [Paenibacillus sp. P96]|uniref:histidine kinase n=1 Tax=Paenibacillus zeirhizosphaerae TaxID=2987519 RepID=A0ABT9FR30_9BACL|nr:HAMP domain-containing sensor histidine kinase [Paenibacillus sp. P96]MDP4097185.1 HAMP domain-containing histidine kinase [Paenibacillus sp. P96]